MGSAAKWHPDGRYRAHPCGYTTSPDLLKNTPSNIARLEDVIEQCRGRQKYLAQTTSPSDGSDVRWYFCKVPLAEHGHTIAETDQESTLQALGCRFRYQLLFISTVEHKVPSKGALNPKSSSVVLKTRPKRVLVQEAPELTSVQVGDSRVSIQP
ncbi:hypothetical protein DY000_02053470 [Brassica cretica]|uniref:Uncharacterized protein n=1 Tax=Brassica cretica TaxID=69181 RepID=A0ABQ7ADV5_BRACR|nr:hypothetical protein DY000_02053470 [Brassica cretica]